MGNHAMKRPASSTVRLPRLFTIRQVAEHLSISDKTVRRWVEDGSLVVHRIGRQLRISEEDLAAFIKLRRNA